MVLEQIEVSLNSLMLLDCCALEKPKQSQTTGELGNASRPQTWPYSARVQTTGCDACTEAGAERSQSRF